MYSYLFKSIINYKYITIFFTERIEKLIWGSFLPNETSEKYENQRFELKF